jgi:protein-S-isoprenylcysteine O-methyltransferase Ste14
MDKTFLVAIYLAGLLFAELLRLPQRIARFKNRGGWQKGGPPKNFWEGIVLTAVIGGMWILPLIYAVTNWLNPLDYQLPTWALWITLPLFLISLLIRLTAQRTIAQNWSHTLETAPEHRLIQSGIYSITRHPIYLSLIFWAAAQHGLLQNNLAGFGGAAAVILIYLIRVPREEKLMLEVFGDEYCSYMERTGRFYPKRRTSTKNAVTRKQ